jgi:hypothetical protein
MNKREIAIYIEILKELEKARQAVLVNKKNIKKIRKYINEQCN